MLNHNSGFSESLSNQDLDNIITAIKTIQVILKANGLTNLQDSPYYKSYLNVKSDDSNQGSKTIYHEYFADNTLPIISGNNLKKAGDFGNTSLYKLIETGVLKPKYFPGFRKPYFLISDILAALSESPKEAYK